MFVLIDVRLERDGQEAVNASHTYLDATFVLVDVRLERDGREAVNVIHIAALVV